MSFEVWIWKQRERERVAVCKQGQITATQIICQRNPDRWTGLRHWKHAGPRWTLCGATLYVTSIGGHVVDVDRLPGGMLLCRQVRQRSANSVHRKLIVSNLLEHLDPVTWRSLCYGCCTAVQLWSHRLVETRLNTPVCASKWFSRLCTGV